MQTVGLLYPGHSAEDDFTALERRLAGLPAPAGEIRLPLLDLGGHARLAAGARTLLESHRAHALMWACTSGSSVFGWDGWPWPRRTRATSPSTSWRSCAWAGSR